MEILSVHHLFNTLTICVKIYHGKLTKSPLMEAINASGKKIKDAMLLQERKQHVRLSVESFEHLLGGYTTESMMHGQYNADRYCHIPSHTASLSFGQYQIVLLCDRVTLCQSCYTITKMNPRPLKSNSDNLTITPSLHMLNTFAIFNQFITVSWKQYAIQTQLIQNADVNSH